MAISDRPACIIKTILVESPKNHLHQIIFKLSVVLGEFCQYIEYVQMYTKNWQGHLADMLFILSRIIWVILADKVF